MAVCGPDLPLISRSTNGSDSITVVHMYLLHNLSGRFYGLLPRAIDPKRSISFLHSRRSAKPNFFAMEIYEAVVGGLNVTAITCRSLTLQTGSLKDCFTLEPAGRAIPAHQPLWLVAHRPRSGRNRKESGHTMYSRCLPVRIQSALKSSVRHRPRCRGTEQCFPAWYGRAATERPCGTSCVCRSALPSFVASNTSRRRMYPGLSP
jgi:hypothetical protein